MKRHKLLAAICAALVVIGIVTYLFGTYFRNKELVAIATKVIELDTMAYDIPEEYRGTDKAKFDEYKQSLYKQFMMYAVADTFSFNRSYETNCKLIDEQFSTQQYYEIDLKRLEIGGIKKTEDYISVKIYVEISEQSSGNGTIVVNTHYDVKLIEDGETWKMVEYSYTIDI